MAYSSNLSESDIFERFRSVIGNIEEIYTFSIAETAFNIPGYYRIKRELKKVGKIQILVGVDTAKLFQKYKSALQLIAPETTEAQAKAIYAKDFISAVDNAAYYEEIEQGIREFIVDVSSGLVEIRIQTTTELKNNIYLLEYKLPPSYYAIGEGGIVGTDKLSQSIGQRSPKFAVNTVLDPGEQLNQIKSEYKRLWEKSLPITYEDIEQYRRLTHLGQRPTPHDLYMRILTDYFGAQVDQRLSFELPEDFKELKYQIDAVIQGYDMMMRHNGFFLADVVGLGKTVVATLTAKRFVDANGRGTKILVVTPPGIPKDNWTTTFDKFGLTPRTHYVTNGSLEKVLDQWHDEYPPKEEYDLIIVDEAHKFRNDTSQMYDDLQRICKAGRANVGNVKSLHKMIILVSATPLNNRPDDLYNLVRLFQDVRNSTISGVSNLQKYFAPKIAEYKKIMQGRTESAEGQKTLVERITELYEPIRREVIDQVTIRRTRENLKNNPVYKRDLEIKGVKLPEVERPRVVKYQLNERLSALFGRTMSALTEGLHYARYRALERFTEEYRGRYPKGRKISNALGVLYRRFLVKRLESSFEALNISLKRLLHATEVMIKMFENDKVIIEPDLKINRLHEEGFSFEEIIEEGVARFGYRVEEFVYPASAFDPEFLKELYEDAEILRELIQAWDGVDSDPKFDRFAELMRTELFDAKINPTGKLVIFSESKDTIQYLARKIRERFVREDVLEISAENRDRNKIKIIENFDANYDGRQRNDYNIVITTDGLSESVNLHRSNVISHYDTPYNVSRLIQRDGRVNRIGSVAGSIYNFLFHPCDEGNKEIGLYENSIIKLQGIHSAYGEDAQIYSTEEIVQQFELFNPKIGDDEDRRGLFLNELREFYDDFPEEYERVKRLPRKSRTTRLAETGFIKGIFKDTSLVYVSSAYKNAYYIAKGQEVQELTFLDAARLFQATKDEPRGDAAFDFGHFQQVGKSFDKYEREIMQYANESIIGIGEKDPNSALASRYLRAVWRGGDKQLREKVDLLIEYIDTGTYSRLPKEVMKLKRKYKPEDALHFGHISAEVDRLYDRYYTEKDASNIVEFDYGVPAIVLSETFIE